jgi:hypothetical protein
LLWSEKYKSSKRHKVESLKKFWDGTFTVRYKELVNGGD